LNRRVREGSLSAATRDTILINFLLDFEQQYHVIPLDDIVLSIARSLTGKYPLRTLDAIQLACAQRIALLAQTSLTFISSDNNLLTAAAAEGFAVDNPLNHP
jgi:hypothetical protein